MKLGPALKLRALLARKLGACTVCLHCAHCHQTPLPALNAAAAAAAAAGVAAATPTATPTATAAATDAWETTQQHGELTNNGGDFTGPGGRVDALCRPEQGPQDRTARSTSHTQAGSRLQEAHQAVTRLRAGLPCGDGRWTLVLWRLRLVFKCSVSRLQAVDGREWERCSGIFSRHATEYLGETWL